MGYPARARAACMVGRSAEPNTQRARTGFGTCCLERKYELLHADRDFDAMETHLGLRVVRAELSAWNPRARPNPPVGGVHAKVAAVELVRSSNLRRPPRLRA